LVVRSDGLQAPSKLRDCSRCGAQSRKTRVAVRGPDGASSEGALIAERSGDVFGRPIAVLGVITDLVRRRRPRRRCRHHQPAGSAGAGGSPALAWRPTKHPTAKAIRQPAAMAASSPWTRAPLRPGGSALENGRQTDFRQSKIAQGFWSGTETTFVGEPLRIETKLV